AISSRYRAMSRLSKKPPPDVSLAVLFQQDPDPVVDADSPGGLRMEIMRRDSLKGAFMSMSHEHLRLPAQLGSDELLPLPERKVPEQRDPLLHGAGVWPGAPG